VLCERDGDGWVERIGTDGSKWLLTDHDPKRGDVGVRTLSWDPPEVEWDVPDTEVWAGRAHMRRYRT
jgi:hypothetical protein